MNLLVALTGRPFLALCLSLAVLSLAACNGGGGGDGDDGGGGDQGAQPISQAEAYAFLNKASFGATAEDAEHLIDLEFDVWLDEQVAEPASLQLPYLQSLPKPQNIGLLNIDRVDQWYRNVINGPDQLRQRVAFALSEIFVVSQLSALGQAPYALADYYDQLALHAFGNFRQLMEVVTLHPAMGAYLSMLGNQKPNLALNIRPDENYARELMQLFSIGLVELNIDGTQKLDGMGQPIPTYSQSIIEGFAHVYTGWHYANAPSFEQARRSDDNQVVPMQLYPDFHDDGAKLLLNGEMTAANQGGELDLQQALDNIFNHANVGPFIAIRLIQRLVSSNPSAAYIERIATVFNNNGVGVRGDLEAVVRAILLDPEAGNAIAAAGQGKLKEPLLRVTQLLRVFDARSNSGKFPFAGAYVIFGQGPLQAPSVFNFFTPFYAPTGEIQAANQVSPEMEIATEYLNTQLTNYFFGQAFVNTSASTTLGDDDVYIDIDDEIALAGDDAALIDSVALQLLGGGVSASLQAELERMLLLLAGNPEAKVGEAIFLIVSSPEYAVQR